MKEFKNKNLVARIRFNEFNGYVVSTFQIIGNEEDSFDLKTGFKTLEAAQKYAQKIIN